VQEQLAAAHAERDAAQDELASLVAERDELQRQLHERTTELGHARADEASAGAVDDRLATLESRLDQAVGLLGTLDSVDALERRLAAVEAVNAAAKLTVTRLEEQLAERTHAYDELLERLHTRPQASAPSPVAAGPYAVFATIGGTYELVEAEGPIPRPGESIELGGRMHAVVRVGRAIGSDRPTVYTTPEY
jgi:uncharacterized coiled-coil protein SlyX